MAEDVKPKERTLDQPILDAEVVAEELEKKDEGVPTDTDIEQIATSDEEAAPAAEAIHPEVSPEVATAGVITHHDAGLAQEVIETHPDGDVAPAGENHPVRIATGENISLPNEPEKVFPPVMTTGAYANGETAPLEQATKGRWSLLKFAKLPKILGGKKAA